jgi:hypothetical protein
LGSSQIPDGTDVGRRLPFEDGFLVARHDRKFQHSDEREKFGSANPALAVMSEQNPEALVYAVTQRYGKIDVLVSNDLCLTPRTYFENLSVDDYRSVLEPCW